MYNPIPLTPIDHIFTGAGSYPIEFVFTYNAIIDEEKLRTSLEETLNHFTPAKSTLKINSDGKYVFIPLEKGYSLDVINSSVNFKDTEKRDQFIDPVKSVEGEILTRVRLTQTPNGSVLGVSISHAVVDGFSYFYFLSSWARVFNGLDVFPPSHDRNLLIKPEKRGDNIDSDLVLKDAGLFYDQPRTEIHRDKLIWENVHLSQHELKTHLGEAQKDCDVRLSFNDIIVGILWKKYMKKWNKHEGDHLTFISCPFDYRRLLPGFPKTYFGNAVALATTPLNYEKLMEAKLSELAVLVRNNIKSVNEEYIFRGLNTLSELTSQKGVVVNENLHVASPQDGLLVTNLSRLPVNQIEFGAGPPVSYEILTPANRGAVVLPAEDGVQVRVCCPID